MKNSSRAKDRKGQHRGSKRSEAAVAKRGPAKRGARRLKGTKGE